MSYRLINGESKSNVAYNLLKINKNNERNGNGCVLTNSLYLCVKKILTLSLCQPGSSLKSALSYQSNGIFRSRV